MWTCKNCGTEVDNDKLLTCFNCGHGKDGSTPVDQETLAEAKSINLTPGPAKASRFGRSSLFASTEVSVLRIFGWIALIAGMVAALLIIANIPERPLYSQEPSAAPQYFAAATGIAFQGIFAFVLCRVIAEIAEDVKLIRRETFRRR
jgi:hypothetical protein